MLESSLDLGLQSACVVTEPGPEYAGSQRLWQGIPGLERAADGRLWATWYSGGAGEGIGNYVVLHTSDDDGANWAGPELVVAPNEGQRCYDPCLWHDPRGRLWLFWAQSTGFEDTRAGVWCIHCEDARTGTPRWSQPRRIANGVMMNKPTVLSSGAWLAPTAVWAYGQPQVPELAAEQYSNALCSLDEGVSWTPHGGADVPDRQFDEQMIVERRDGSLWMLVRTTYGLGESSSSDGGHTWSPGRPSGITGPGSRFFIRRLRSGRLLLVNHHDFSGRNNLTAVLSEDDGRSWRGGLLLDSRDQVSYPDGIEDPSGLIRIIYDRDRQGAGEILLAAFREKDVLAGRPVSPDARLRMLVDHVG